LRTVQDSGDFDGVAAQRIAAPESSRAAGLYDRRGDECHRIPAF
jgi:hypothetical protein